MNRPSFVNQYSVNNYIFSGLLLLMATACDRELNVQPVQQINQRTALLNEQDVRVTLTGAYRGLLDGDVFGGAYQYIGELIGDDREVVFGGTFSNVAELWRKRLTTTNTQAQATWLDSYVVIDRTNNVLANLNLVEQANRPRIEGAALFIRGLTYFGLVKTFANAWGNGDNNTNPGVPIVLTPTLDFVQADSRPRASVAQVYARILDDLTRAVSLLPASAAGEDAGFATRAGATVLLARIYLIQGNLAAARDAANGVINSGTRSLAFNFADVFDEQSAGHRAEMLFKLVVTEQIGTNDLKTFFAPVSNEGRGDARVQRKHVNLYGDTTDVRGQFFTLTNSGTRRFTSKYNSFNGNQFNDVPVIRLAEMYLTRAEANFRLGTSVGAAPLEDINRLRARAGATPVVAADLTLARILLERRLELAFEGFQADDLKRTSGSLTAIETTPIPANSPRLVLPIPQREIDTNKELRQNAGY